MTDINLEICGQAILFESSGTIYNALCQ